MWSKKKGISDKTIYVETCANSRNFEVLAFLLWYRSNDFPVIRLQEHQAVEQNDDERSSYL